MIRKGLVTFLNTQSIDASINGKFYYHAAPSGALMPWGELTSSGGVRNNMTFKFKDIDDTLYLNIDSPNLFIAKDIADKIVNLLDNFHGDMLPAEDVVLSCMTPKELAGPNGSYRLVIQIRAQYKAIRPDWA